MVSHAVVQTISMLVISLCSIVSVCMYGRVDTPSFYVLWCVSALYFSVDLVYLIVYDSLLLLVNMVALGALGFMFAEYVHDRDRTARDQHVVDVLEAGGKHASVEKDMQVAFDIGALTWCSRCDAAARPL